MEPRNPGMAYLLLAMSMFGVAGLHRFYLGRPFTGLLWLITWGLFGVGTLADLFYVPLMTESENRRLGLDSQGRALPTPGPHRAALPRPEPSPTELAVVNHAPPLRPPAVSVEQAILQLAKENDGGVTVAMVALATGLSLRRAERELGKLVKQGYAERDVTTEGAFLYVFRGLRSTELFDIDSI